MRLSRMFLAATGLGAVVSLGAAGCGSDDNGIGPDAANGNGNGNDIDIDAGPGDADACVPGHGEACGDLNPLDFPEGGEVRIEFFELDHDAARLLNASEAYFYRDQDPLTREIFGPPIAIEREAGDELPDSTVCLDGRAGTHFNLVEWEENQAIYDTREYLDAGDEVKLVERDGDFEIVLTPSSRDEDHPAHDDRAGRSNAQGLTHDLIYLPEDEALNPDEYVVPQNAWFDFEIAGSAQIPAFTPTDGLDLVGGEPLDDFGLYFPSRYDMLGPEPDNSDVADTFEENYFDKGIAYVEGEDFTINVPQINPTENGPATVYIVALFNERNGAHLYCINTNAQEEDTITVPREVIELLPSETDSDGNETGERRGRMSLLHITHHAHIFDERQFHVMGMACKTSFNGWCVVDSDEDREDGYFCPSDTFPESDLTNAEKFELMRSVNEGAAAAYRSLR